MSSTFEFLSSAKEWEKKCLEDKIRVDRLPEGFCGQAGTSWTYPAQLLATLKAYGKQIGLDLSTIAQNGYKKDHIYKRISRPRCALFHGIPGSPSMEKIFRPQTRNPRRAT